LAFGSRVSAEAGIIESISARAEAATVEASNRFMAVPFLWSFLVFI
jgi:hypothetical protein